jgi:ABC-2 type transport system ATP-binding protein
MIKAKNLSKHFGPTIAVENASFEVKKGEVVGFLGPNGAGKTTTMRILTCYLQPDSGTAEIAGHSIHDTPVEVRQKIGYLPENAPLYGDMVVADYLHFIGEVRGMRADNRKKAIEKMIEVTSLQSVIHRPIGELSKGFRQRVGLAQAMLHDPEILIMDEPTSGLDPTQIIEIRALIKKLGTEKTVILSTHILPEVSATCNRVLIISDGEIVASGSPDELTQRAQGKGMITLTIRGPEEEVEKGLREFPGIEEVEKIDGGIQEVQRFRVRSSEEKDISEDLFRLVVGKGWTLSELYKEKVSLEDIFLQLTTKD